MDMRAVADAEGDGRVERPAATSTAQRPTSEWNIATSCGIAVICTVRARHAPMLPPMAKPRMTSTQDSRPTGGLNASVVTTAMAMPAMPKRLPCREDAGDDRPRSARMNRTPATR